MIKFGGIDGSSHQEPPVLDSQDPFTDQPTSLQLVGRPGIAVHEHEGDAGQVLRAVAPGVVGPSLDKYVPVLHFCFTVVEDGHDPSMQDGD
ncbi:MAG: hypothetical protein AAFO29_09665, partial [Actinomycetota bacterium]